MAYFRCGQGGGTSLTIQITTSSAILYGQTITIAKNGTTVGTTTFDNTGNAEYTVDEAGLYTVSVTLSGTTFTDTVEVTDTFDAQIEATPDGSTVLPVNDIQIWLHCANIWDKNYTTLSEVLADTATLLALINSNNAVDYMVRSHDWCDDVCADATAMTYIGANNYAADKLLAGSGTGNWLESICNSTYFESVLNVKVPTMTSNTTPSGVASASSVYNATFQAWKAFNGTNADSNDCWHSGSGQPTVGSWLSYKFTSDVKVCKLSLTSRNYSPSYPPSEFKMQASTDNWSSETDIGSVMAFNGGTTANVTQNYIINGNSSTTKYNYWRAYITAVTSGSSVTQIGKLQMWGRADV